jgi:hypothetical protein
LPLGLETWEKGFPNFSLRPLKSRGEWTHIHQTWEACIQMPFLDICSSLENFTWTSCSML